ncbi:Hypothetical predicted protein [Paramuricea clavata]|uniref:Uncharacterized protein n=1 Tax=Paramuricea clavata TaxID=317549 RepID=A0A7D9DJ09_PARCT|nr:Hypothetical predicted protein [Paramuricea clavata]
MIDEGYWTFKQLRKELEENALTLREYPDGRIRIDFAKGTNSAGFRNLTSILGYRSSNGSTYTPHISDRPVDIHEGLRYLTVSCNLVNREHNIGPYGNRSTVITSLPIDGTRPLFGTTTKYNDIESQEDRLFPRKHRNIHYGLPVSERKRIRRQKYRLTKYGGSFIEYEYLTGRSPFDVENDYKTLIPKTSRGLTKVGQKLFQQSIEAFVYSVLGAQAKTRWSITGQGATSLQTQEVFRKVVKDTIVQYDVTVTISDMRTAIANTHVVLNFAIMPGLILIPSDLRILAKPIPGFSNVLTVAKNGMTFGKNEKVNYTSNPVPTPTNNIDESHDITPVSSIDESHDITPTPTVEDFKPPELRQKSDTQNMALGMAAVASFGLAYLVFRR